MRKQKTILLATIALCLSTALAVGGTYALFTDHTEVNQHLQAGTLKIGLERIAYRDHTLGDDGLMVTSEVNETVVDLRESAKSLFEVEGAVPTAWYESTLRVTNKGSVAFTYGVRILWTADADATETELAREQALAEQLRITVTPQNAEPVSFMLAECARYDIDLGALLAGTNAATFTVKAEFVDDRVLNADPTAEAAKDNDLAQSARLDFDVQVYAVQKTS